MRTRYLRPAFAAALSTLLLVPAASSAAAPRSAEQRPTIKVTDTRLDVVAGKRAWVRGSLPAGNPKRIVRLQARQRGAWRTVARDRTGGASRFRIGLRFDTPKDVPVRLKFEGKTRRIGRLHVYRVANASWYGPGLYGNSMSCGGRLHPGTIGVAHKWLPCGTKVTFRRSGREISVRVVDRGPYIAGREYDLTQATAQRLGFRGHGGILSTR